MQEVASEKAETGLREPVSEFDARGRRVRFAYYCNGGEPLLVGKGRRAAKAARAADKAKRRKILGKLRAAAGKRFDFASFRSRVAAKTAEPVKEKEDRAYETSENKHVDGEA